MYVSAVITVVCCILVSGTHEVRQLSHFVVPPWTHNLRPTFYQQPAAAAGVIHYIQGLKQNVSANVTTLGFQPNHHITPIGLKFSQQFPYKPIYTQTWPHIPPQIWPHLLPQTFPIPTSGSAVSNPPFASDLQRSHPNPHPRPPLTWRDSTSQYAELHTTPVVEKGSFEEDYWKIYFQNYKGPMSPFHDNPLFANEGNKTNAKMEISTKLKSLPTGEEGTLRFYYHNSGAASRKEVRNLDSVPISSSTKLTIIIHGGLESSQAHWIKALTRALLNQEYESEQVILLVDHWDMMVLSSTQRLKIERKIAKKTAELINYFVLHKHLNLSAGHLIGFSMGAKICGMVSNYITGGTLGRLTGLDPTPPYKITEFDPSYFIDDSDATIVTTIRTSIQSDKTRPTSIDFFVNGGSIQPGCDKWYMPQLVQNLCSHLRAPWLLVEAFEQINLTSFKACSCDDYESFISKSCSCKIKNNFGNSINSKSTGKFFLLTNDKPPFSRMIHSQ